MVCGCCGRLFSAVGRDYLGCGAARASQGCNNPRLVRRPKLEAQVLDVLGSRLMRPDLLAAFCTEFIAEWNRMSAEASAGIDVRRRELKVVERKIENILEAVADGLKASGIQHKLSELEARRDELRAASAQGSTAPPALHPNLAQTYAARVAELRRGIDAGKGQDVLEAARALIDKVIVTPGDDPDDPPGIELVGQLMAMLKAAGAFPNGDDVKCRDLVSGLSTCSVKGSMRGQSPSNSLGRKQPSNQEGPWCGGSGRGKPPLGRTGQ